MATNVKVKVNDPSQLDVLNPVQPLHSISLIINSVIINPCIPLFYTLVKASPGKETELN